MLRLLRARPAIRAMLCIGGTICAARGFISPHAVSCQEKLPLTFSKDDLVKRANEGEARIQGEERIRQENVLRELNIAMKEQLGVCVKACGDYALMYGRRGYTHTFSFFTNQSTRLGDERIRTRMEETLRKELPVLLPGVDFKIHDNSHYCETFREYRYRMEVVLSWK